MSNQLDRLVRTDRPKNDESFLGFVLRLTELNVYKAPSWILEGAGLINGKVTNNHDVYKDGGSFVFSRSADLSRLSQLTGVDSSKLDLLRYRQTDRTDSSTTHLICTLPVPKFMIRLRPAKVCPDCLRESNYVRALWDLAPVTACPVHKRMLIDECPNCKRKITWSRQHVSICRCGFDWTEIESVEVEETGLMVSRHIYKLCGISKKEIRKKASKKFPLLNLDLEHFLSSLFFIAGQYQGIGDIRGRHLAPSYTHSELHSLLVKAFLAFSDWPKRYFQFLDWYKEQDFSEYFKLKKKTGLYNEFGFFLCRTIHKDEVDSFRLHETRIRKVSGNALG